MPVAERGAGDVASAVQVQDHGPGMFLRSDSQGWHSAGDHQGDRDPGQGREPPVKFLHRSADLVDVAIVQGGAYPGFSQQGHPSRPVRRQGLEPRTRGLRARNSSATCVHRDPSAHIMTVLERR